MKTPRSEIYTPESSLRIIKDIQEKKSAYWMKEREKTALRVFHEAAVRVPAYKDFLKKNKVDPDKIETMNDFVKLPTISKSNYLRQYPLEAVSLDGTLKAPLVFTSTSGSTGQPFYFSRGRELDIQTAIIHELYLRNGSHGHDIPTLVVVCFGMGVWIGGIITYQAYEMIGKNGYPVSIITPGINKNEIFSILKNLAPQFGQVILSGYAPFLKDIVDEAPRRGIDLSKMKIRLTFAAEAFTDNFRDHLASKMHIANPLLDTMNVYGSADIGTMAFETPVSILVRQLAGKKPELFGDIFTFTAKTPTLAQYDPSFIVFESPENEILLTGHNSIPLVRYSIGDHGGEFNYAEVKGICSGNGIDLDKEAIKAGIKGHVYELPFVYIYERMDFSTTLYGLQIYPETIKEVLIHPSFAEKLTGKLVLMTRFDDKNDQYLEIDLELQRDAEMNDALKKKLLSDIIKNLREKNSEFCELHKHLKDRAAPHLIFWPCEDPTHFRPGVKQTWVKKDNKKADNKKR
jgi:phenylacetate-CoA ligase